MVVNAFHGAMRFMAKGNQGPALERYSQRDDVTLADPLGPPHVGRANLEREARAVASGFADGSIEFEKISRLATGDMGYVLAFERGRVRRSGSTEYVNAALRATMIYRREEDGWRIAHRHADPITTSPEHIG